MIEQKLLRVCTKSNLVCQLFRQVCTGAWSVRYVTVYTGMQLFEPLCTGMYWYIIEKAIYMNIHNVRIQTDYCSVTTCIATCMFYHFATGVKSWVYIHTSDDTLDMLYLLAGVWRPAMTSLVRISFWISQQPKLAEKQIQSLELTVTLESWGWLSRQLGCTALMSDSKSASIGSGAALQWFTGILARGLFGCSCELGYTVEPPANTVGVHPNLKSVAPGQVRPV
jgi:hypothetical protein